MPQIPDRQTKKLSLIGVPGGEIEVYTSILAGDLDKVPESPEESRKHPIKVLTILIKDWNLEDAEGKKLATTEENIGKLDARDVNAIYKELTAFFQTPSDGAGKN